MSTVSKMQVQQLVAEERFLQALARSLLGDDEAARDVAQEACLQAMRRPPEGSGSLGSWLAVVVRNLVRNRQRGEARREHHERAAAARIPKPEELLAQQELRRQVVELVTELPEIYRDALLLRYFEGLPPRRIAHRLIPGTEGASVAGRITIGGEPAPGLRVLCEPSTANQKTQTDATGHFRLDGFPPREVTFRVLEGIGGSRKLWTQTLRLPASGTVPLEIDLEMVMLELMVRSTTDAPAPDHEATVFGSHPEGATFELRDHTDGAGKIRISIPAAAATARIQGPLGTATCPLHPHADEPLQIEVALATPGVISGRIIPTPGGITPRCVVFNRASDDSPVAWTLVRGETLRFHQANLEPGRYELRILDTDLEEHEAIPRFFDLPEHEGLLDQIFRVGAPRK